ncbi:hypothetical protein [Nocardia sp. NBC_01327]|uniref:hypothetical protein n=1 Tax=Nocardia sp. NBC_01327 TaxID=2903593 RepID=UPI002E0E2CCE|nr:hypothetical protein OG326_23970 [Nocardia sp. NBC_01327]
MEDPDDDLDPNGQPDYSQPPGLDQHPDFLEFLDRADDELRQLCDRDIPELGQRPDPWTREGLQVIAQAALRELPDIRSLTREQAALFGRMARGIGHTFVLAGGGHWEYMVLSWRGDRPAPPAPVVVPASSPAWVTPGTLVGGVILSGTDIGLLDLYDHTVADHAAWVAAGTPDPHDWFAQQH